MFTGVRKCSVAPVMSLSGSVASWVMQAAGFEEEEERDIWFICFETVDNDSR